MNVSSLGLRIAPYLIFDRNENEAVRDRIKCVQCVVVLFNNNPIVQLIKRLSKKKKTFSRQKLQKTVIKFCDLGPL